MAVDREDDITESWQANAGRWVAAVRGSQIRSRAVATDRAVVAAVARYRPGRVLDIGCGEGWLVRRLKSESGCKAIGVDGSPALVAAARQADPGGDYRVLTYDEIVANPARLGGPHDVAVFNFALLAEAIAPLLGAVANSLAPGGTVIIQTLRPGEATKDEWRVEDFAAMDGKGWKPMPWYSRTMASWHREISAAGLSVTGLREPVDPETRTPLSLVLECRLPA